MTESCARGNWCLYSVLCGSHGDQKLAYNPHIQISRLDQIHEIANGIGPSVQPGAHDKRSGQLQGCYSQFQLTLNADSVA